MSKISKNLKLEKILTDSKIRFLTTKEIEYIFKILKNKKNEIPNILKKKIISKIPCKPKKGNLYIIILEEKKKNWKNDFYNYEKRRSKNNRGILEFKQNLKSNFFKDDLFVNYSNVVFEDDLDFEDNLDFEKNFDIKNSEKTLNLENEQKNFKFENEQKNFKFENNEKNFKFKNEQKNFKFENEEKIFNFQNSEKNFDFKNPGFEKKESLYENFFEEDFVVNKEIIKTSDNNKNDFLENEKKSFEKNFENNLKINSLENFEKDFKKNFVKDFEKKFENNLKINSEKNKKKDFEKLQRRIYNLKCSKNLKIVHYNLKKNKNFSKKNLIKSELKNLQITKKDFFFEKCQKNKIIEVVPKIVDLNEKTKILIILKNKITLKKNPTKASNQKIHSNLNFDEKKQQDKSKENFKIEIFFGDEKTEGILLNPYTIKTICPKSKNEQILQIKILIEKKRIIQSKKFFFEYKNFSKKKKNINNIFESSDEELADNLIDHFQNFSKNEFETKLSGILDSVSKDKICYNDFFENFENFFENKFEKNEIEKKVRILQSCIKGWIIRKKFKLMKQSAIKIQTKFRQGMH